MSEFIEQIKNEARGIRCPDPALLKQLDRDAEPRKREVDAALKRIESECRVDVAALEAKVRERKAQADRAGAAVRDAAAEVRERVEQEIISELYANIAPQIEKLELEASGLLAARAIVDQVAVTDARAQCELGVEFDAPRHLAIAFCKPELARNPHAVNNLGTVAWGTDVSLGLESIAKLAIDSFKDERTMVDAFRRLRQFVELHSRAARRDLIAEQAAERFELRCSGVDADSYRRLLELYETRNRERAHERSVTGATAEHAAIRRARAGDVAAADGKPAGWFDSVRKFINEELFGPVLAVQPHHEHGPGEPDELAKKIGLDRFSRGEIRP
jgi:hypothetical protein